MMGFSAATVAGGPQPGTWRVADTAVEEFDQVITEAQMSAADDAVVRDGVELFRLLRSDGSRCWVHVERMTADKVDDWRDRKRSGPGRDLRIASNFKDTKDYRATSHSQSLGV